MCLTAVTSAHQGIYPSNIVPTDQQSHAKCCQALHPKQVPGFEYLKITSSAQSSNFLFSIIIDSLNSTLASKEKGNMRLINLLSLASLAFVGSAQNSSVPAVPEPAAPGLTFLYTCYAHCQDGLYKTQGPRGIRTAIPIIGGNFTGPRLKGSHHPKHCPLPIDPPEPVKGSFRTQHANHKKPLLPQAKSSTSAPTGA